jgi:S-phase kinase-associated protein 1
MATNLFLVSEEGQKFEIETAKTAPAGLIQTILQDEEGTEEIPLTVKSEHLEKAVEYLNHIHTTPATVIEKPLKGEFRDVVSEWEHNFVDVNHEAMFDLMQAANYLDIKSMLSLVCAKAASMIKGKSPQEIREMFNIENDFSPEEEAALIEENKWAWES